MDVIHVVIKMMHRINFTICNKYISITTLILGYLVSIMQKLYK